MQIKIGPLIYTIVPMSEETKHEALGLIDYRKQKIYIDFDLPAEAQALTLLHEILHAVNNLGGYSGDDEKHINHTSNLLLQILRDNPGLWRQVVDEGLEPNKKAQAPNQNQREANPSCLDGGVTL